MTGITENSGLLKGFGWTVALDGLDLTVTDGEVHGFLGPTRAACTPAPRSSVDAGLPLPELLRCLPLPAERSRVASS